MSISGGALGLKDIITYAHAYAAFISDNLKTFKNENMVNYGLIVIQIMDIIN